MLRTFTAAALALSLIAGPALAQGSAPNTSAPVTQPAKADTKTTAVKTAIKGKTAKAHVRHVKHATHVKHVKHAKHVKHIKHVKRVKQPIEKTRG